MVGFYIGFRPFEPSLVSVLNSCKESLLQLAKNQYLGHGTFTRQDLSETNWIDLPTCLEALDQDHWSSRITTTLMDTVISNHLRPFIQKTSGQKLLHHSASPNLALPAASPALPARAVRPTRWIYLEYQLATASGDCYLFPLTLGLYEMFVVNHM